MNPAPTSALIACDVFADEIAGLTRVSGPFVHTIYFEMGLHDRPDELRKRVQDAIDFLESQETVETILLAYGVCGNALLGIEARRCTLVLPRAADCISILLGSDTARENALRREPGTYFYSPGWIRGRRVPGPDRARHLREEFTQRYPDDEEMVEDLLEADSSVFAHHRKAAYVDITGDCAAETYCRGCARHLGWAFERLRGDPSFLSSLLNGDFPPERFLLVPPGHRVGYDGATGTLVPEKAE